MARVESVSSMAWVDKLTLKQLDLDAGLCVVRPRPGQSDIGRFVGQRQRERLGGELTKLVGRPIRVELDAPGPTAAQDRTAPTDGKPGSSSSERQRAMGLPLVKDVLDAFPDAVLIDAKREEKKPEAPETLEPEDDTD